MKLRFFPILLLLAGPAYADVFGGGAFTINFVTIGDAGNTADDTTYGSVGYSYAMGVNEVSRNMIDAYNTLSGGPMLTMADLSGNGGNGANRPATGISWNEAARFVNWLNTSSGYSAAYKFETGGFNDDITLWNSGDAGFNALNPFRNSNAVYYLPSEDEWYKAAYYDPTANGGLGGYWDYATGSDTAPTAVTGGNGLGFEDTAVYDGQIGPADITNAGGLSFYGTMAQNGNAFEWNESAFDGVNDSASEERTARGGSWEDPSGLLLSSYAENLIPTIQNATIGFRVAAVPEPSAFFLTLLGMISMVTRRRR